MPAIVNHEEMRNKILDNFEEYALTHPINDISLRAVAKNMNTSHARIQYYFKDRNELLHAFSRRISEQYSDFLSMVKNRFLSQDIRTPKELIRHFVDVIYTENADSRYRKYVAQIYALSHYDDVIKDIFAETLYRYRREMKEMLQDIYGCDMDSEALALIALQEGLVIYSSQMIMDIEEIKKVFMCICLPDII